VTSSNHTSIVVIGVGNEICGDDAVGLIVSRQLKRKLADDIVISEQTNECAGLVEIWKDFKTVVLIDAMKSGVEPGTIQRFEAEKSRLPTEGFRSGCSTHAFGIPQVVELARCMGQLPHKLLVYGIEGKCFDEGAGMSAVVARASQELVEQVVHEIGQLQISKSYTNRQLIPH
jgi:hydrogenase maturation protease